MIWTMLIAMPVLATLVAAIIAGARGQPGYVRDKHYTETEWQ